MSERNVANLEYGNGMINDKKDRRRAENNIHPYEVRGRKFEIDGSWSMHLCTVQVTGAQRSGLRLWQYNCLHF